MLAGKPSEAQTGSRRVFLKKSALGIAGVCLSARKYPLFFNVSNKVVVVRHKNVFGPDGHAR